jgi:hypothetical protein
MTTTTVLTDEEIRSAYFVDSDASDEGRREYVRARFFVDGLLAKAQQSGEEAASAATAIATALALRDRAFDQQAEVKHLTAVLTTDMSAEARALVKRAREAARNFQEAYTRAALVSLGVNDRKVAPIDFDKVLDALG